eukprot:607284-Prymnesium_polylepis.1
MATYMAGTLNVSNMISARVKKRCSGQLRYARETDSGAGGARRAVACGDFRRSASSPTSRSHAGLVLTRHLLAVGLGVERRL